MPRRALLVVGCTLVAALTGLFIGGQRVLERDRRQLYASYADGRRQLVEAAARGFEAELADIGDDLTLATALLEGADSPQVAERELHAIATIKREYLAMSARDGEGPITKVSALDAPEGVASRFDSELTHMIDVASSVPGVTQASAALAPLGDPAAWYRIFARRQIGTTLTVAVLLDATLIRLVLMPVALRLLGARAWWIPRWLDRILPEVTLGHGGIRETPALEGRQA